MTAPVPLPPSKPEPTPVPAPDPVPAVIDTNHQSGRAVITLLGPDGGVKSRQTVDNMITDVGDEYHARRIVAGAAPLAPADVPTVTGMKLGTGVTSAAKSGAGAVLAAYITGANRVFDTGFPNAVSQGAGLGWTAEYQCTFPAGSGTSLALTEVVLVTDAATDATSASAATTARLVFSATPKNANDTLIIQWAHLQKGV